MKIKEYRKNPIKLLTKPSTIFVLFCLVALAGIPWISICVFGWWLYKFDPENDDNSDQAIKNKKYFISELKKLGFKLKE